MTGSKNGRQLTGLVSAAAAFILWGVLPAYWKLLSDVSPYEILAHRIVWSFVFVTAVILLTGRTGEVKKILRNKKTLTAVVAASFFVTVNWLVYIWAVNTGRIVEASLGYYINPILTFFLGAVVLKERPDRLKIWAIASAGCGVLAFSLGLGRIPWLSLVLAVSFGTYGLIKKITGAGALASLAVETAAAAPFAIAYILYSSLRGEASFLSGDMTAMIFLPLSGIVTALPLFFFAAAANRIKLSSVGFMQFLSPSINLVLGTLVYGELFSLRHAVSFSFIWLGLAMYLSSQLRQAREAV